MPTANETLRDRLLSHRIGLDRLEASEVRKALALLKGAERRLLRRLEARAKRAAMLGVDPGPLTTRHTRELIGEFKALVNEANVALGRSVTASLQDIAAYEAEFTTKLLADTLPTGLGYAVRPPPVELVQAIVREPAFQGHTLGKWLERSTTRQAAKIRRAKVAIEREIAEGALTGEPIAEIVRRVGRLGANGRLIPGEVLRLGRRNAESLVRTGVSQVTARARQAVYNQNRRVVQGYIWLTTLDLRACVRCIARSEKRYDLDYQPVGHGYAWAGGPGAIHFRDRCVSLAWLKPARLVNRKAGPRAQASMTGEVPAGTTAEGYLRTRPESELRRVFGVKRAELFKGGKLSVRQMLDPRGLEPLTLAELGAGEGVAVVEVTERVLVEVVGSPSPAFVADVQSALDDLPVGIRRSLKRQGLSARAGTRLRRIDPTLGDMVPRGHVAGTFDRTSAYAEPIVRRVTIAESYKTDGRWVKAGQTKGTVFHEVGHIADDGFGMRSRFDDAFKAAWDSDVATMGLDPTGVPRRNGSLSYYAFGGDVVASRSEAFAEAFAAALGENTTPDFARYFPSVMEYMNKWLSSIS